MTELDPVRVAREAVAEREAGEGFVTFAEEILLGMQDKSVEVSSAILGARAMQAAGAGVRVKALVWHESRMPSWNDDWHSVPTAYTVRCADENGWKWQGFGGHGYERSAASAKAAAQADYERRILSALSTAGPQEAAVDLGEQLERDFFKLTPSEVHRRLNEMPTPAPAADVAGLVKELRDEASVHSDAGTPDSYIAHFVKAADAIEALQAEVEYQSGEMEAIIAQATAAEAEAAALRERNAEHEARFEAETSRADHYKAEAAALRAEVKRLRALNPTPTYAARARRALEEGERPADTKAGG